MAGCRYGMSVDPPFGVPAHAFHGGAVKPVALAVREPDPCSIGHLQGRAIVAVKLTV